MPQDEKKGPWDIDHEPRTIMPAQSLMAIIAEKVVLRQGHCLPSLYGTLRSLFDGAPDPDNIAGA